MRKRVSIEEYLYVLMAMLMLVGGTIFPNYATDTYGTLLYPDNAARYMINVNGRPITALIYKLAILFGIKDVASIWVFTILGFCFLYAAIILYEDSLRGFINNDLIRCLISVLALCNIYIVEYLMFLEKISFLLAIFCCVAAYKFTKELIEGVCNNLMANIILSMLLLIVAACTYQPILSLFVVLLLPVIFDKQSSWKKKIKWLCISAIMYGCAGIVDAVVLLLVDSSRVGNNTSVLDKLFNFIWLPIDSITAYKIVPRGFFVATVAVIMLLCVVKAKKNEKKSILFQMLLVAAGTEVCALGPIILGVGWFRPRVLYVFASLPIMLVVFAYVNQVFTDKKEYEFSSINKVLMLIIAVYLVVTSVGFNLIYKEKYITNSLDEYCCVMIGNKICDYEESSGNVVRNIVVYEDSHIDAYEEMFTSDAGFRTSTFIPLWSDIMAINYFMGREFERGETDNDIAEFFAQKDWKVYSEEQLMFVGDTLHICKW